MSSPQSEPLPPSAFRRVTRRRAALALLGLLLVATLVLVRFNLKWRFAGLFLLEGKGGQLLELKDDLYLGDGSRLIAGVDFGPIRREIYEKHYPEKLLPALALTWDESDGSGHVDSHFPGGRTLVTSFGRFLDDGGEETKGLFVGGGLPESVMADNTVKLSETGMAFFDGRRWLHIWCSSNEAIGNGWTADKLVYPSAWRFLGSSVIQNGPRRVVLSSAHEALIDGVPVRIDRYAYFHSGETFFRLGIRITNVGNRPTAVFYLYGDEPWLGEYGSSKGNVGWTRDGIVERATRLDVTRHRYMGMYDCGNSLVGPNHDFTKAANFIEWFGGNMPELAYFGNGAGYDEAEVADGAPLASNTRFLGLQWGPRLLNPGEDTKIYLAVGMASVDPATGLPVKPVVPRRSDVD
jgi:hypothetical protein